MMKDQIIFNIEFLACCPLCKETGIGVFRNDKGKVLKMLCSQHDFDVFYAPKAKFPHAKLRKSKAFPSNTASELSEDKNVVGWFSVDDSSLYTDDIYPVLFAPPRSGGE